MIKGPVYGHAGRQTKPKKTENQVGVTGRTTLEIEYNEGFVSDRLSPSLGSRAISK
jgi:hypothetical protein